MISACRMIKVNTSADKLQSYDCMQTSVADAVADIMQRL